VLQGEGHAETREGATACAQCRRQATEARDLATPEARPPARREAARIGEHRPELAREPAEVAAAGPLSGLVVAVAAAWLGLSWSTVVPETPHTAFGGSVFTQLLVWLHFGRLPDGMMLYTHPIADAAWLGFLVTAINLLPAGQLDGGRIAYAVFGSRHGRIGRVTVLVLSLLGLGVMTWAWLTGYGWLAPLLGLNWLMLAALIRFFVGYRAGPILDGMTPPTRGRRALGIACLLLAVLMLPPVFILPE